MASDPLDDSPLSPWSRLTDREQTLLFPTLTESGSAPDPDLLRIAAARFDDGMLQSGSPIELEAQFIPERLLTLRNFMEQAGAGTKGALWEHIKSLKGVRQSYLELSVHSRDALLEYLREAGFVVNCEPCWSSHKFDSARAMTRWSRQPSLHFANDRADEPAYGPDYFFVHWDATSVWFEESRWWGRWLPGARLLERIRAALKHQRGFAATRDVQAYLAKPDSSERGDIA